MFEAEKENKKITVLGKTFNSEEERRTYFREELRKKLPELKQMEGFPIGEDEDILNLSDPPYYTACPNPWLNEFIGFWEEEKQLFEKKDKRKKDFVIKAPYTADVSSGKNNPIYNAHSYHTKVPHPAIMRYLLHYTQPGDIVFDGFSGTGMTGVAAQTCQNPNIEIQTLIEDEFKQSGLPKPIWGLRKSICIELSPAAGFISYSFNKSKDIDLFQKESAEILELARDMWGWAYETRHITGEICKINFIVWSDVYSCVSCGEEVVFWNQAVDHDLKKAIELFPCSACGSINSKRSAERITQTEFDILLGESIQISKVVPVLINYSYNKKRIEKIPDKDDLKVINKIKSDLKNLEVPENILPEGYNLNQPRNSHGITHIHHFYTARNLAVLSFIFKEIKDRNDPDLMSWFTATLTWCGRENRLHLGNYFNKKGGAITSLRGTWYISSLSVEVNVLDRFKLRTRSSIFHSQNRISNTSISNQSATDIRNIGDGVIDYIFVDPPFGANLMYSELNVVWESWLRVFTNNKDEAIINTSQRKGLFEYQHLIETSFSEFYRVLKPGKWITIEFSNTNASIWNGIQNSLAKVGFIVTSVSGLDKKKGSFKAVTTTTAVKQDLVISCYKPSSQFDEKFKKHQSDEVGIWDFVEEHLHHLPIHLMTGKSTSAIIERSPKILFDRLIAFYVQKGLPVPIDAGKFQLGLRDCFIERDGMFFTNEQIQEYDKKKIENPEFIQLSILISSERDGLLWLKNVLLEKTLAYQDIQPLWMQALAGTRKGDVIPELAKILQENFLKDAEGKWYTPDPENEADLEKLRTKRLLKQFDTYKTEAAKPKAKKIKEVRVEALRAGFKQCYQDKDFQSIVSVGDKIPNNLLMEDEVLLQFYDIASTRV